MFDAIVVGSGMSGGWAAKELCERGLKTLVIERGGHVEHGADYLDSRQPWELENFGMVPEAEAAEHYAVQARQRAGRRPYRRRNEDLARRRRRRR
jgi:choline dehydrogenase-like flavoprotein